jgi:hypothetical protein
MRECAVSILFAGEVIYLINLNDAPLAPGDGRGNVSCRVNPE